MEDEIVIIAGGMSSEREISLKSGQQVLEGALAAGHRATLAVIEDAVDIEKLDIAAGDTVLIVLHGGFGEDGRIQAYLEVRQVLFNGAGHMASAVGMDKLLAKQVAMSLGVPTAPFVRLDSADNLPGFSDVVDVVGLPFVLKPRAQGCSVGLALVDDEGQFLAALEGATSYDGRALAERYVEGIEVTVGMLDGDVLPIVEIGYQGRLFDYDNKFVPGRCSYRPCSLPESVRKKLIGFSAAFFGELRITDYGRIDYVVDRAGEPIFLEINTLPGLAPRSVFVYVCELAGLTYPDMISRLIEALRKKGPIARGAPNRPTETAAEPAKKINSSSRRSTHRATRRFGSERS